MYSMNENEVKRKVVNINNKLGTNFDFMILKNFCLKQNDENFSLSSNQIDERTKETNQRKFLTFANTYGGYILLGVNDDKTIGGCKKWTEQRIHITIHDCITPTPNFDVRKFTSKGRHIFVIKIEEGAMPPYITNRGDIYERVSSGSFPIKDSTRLNQLYQKKKDELIRVKNIVNFYH